jgi:uncharacterized membrane protein
MKLPESSIFGFPNSLLGLMGYSAVLAIAMYFIFHNHINRYFSLLVTAGSFVAFIFSYWMMYVSLFKASALCPYCLLSAFSATVIFFSMILFTLKNNSFSFKEKTNNIVQKFLSKGYYFPFIIIWFAIILGFVIQKIAKG